MTKKKSKKGIYGYIYKNEPFKNSSNALSNLIDGIYDNIVGVFSDDKKLVEKSSKQISKSFDSLMGDVKHETTKYISTEIKKYGKTSKNKNRRKNGKSEPRPEATQHSS